MTARETCCLALFAGALVLSGCQDTTRVTYAGETRDTPTHLFLANRLDFVRDQARADLSCPALSDVSTLPKDADQKSIDFADLFLAQGCEKRILYAQVACDSVQFVPISQDSPMHKQLRAPHGTAACDSAGRALVYIRLSENGARDLECPRPEVIPQEPRHSQPHTVEGCGKRAYYAPGMDAKPVHVVPLDSR
jgi:hypothetical protein